MDELNEVKVMVKSYMKPSIGKYTRSKRYLDASLRFRVKYLTISLLKIVHEICEILSHYPVTIQKRLNYWKATKKKCGTQHRFNWSISQKCRKSHGKEARLT